jgi:rubredoxin
MRNMKYACEICGTVYDESLGDPKQRVPAGTPYSDLPPYYGCPSCGADIESFIPKKEE